MSRGVASTGAGDRRRHLLFEHVPFEDARLKEADTLPITYRSRFRCCQGTIAIRDGAQIRTTAKPPAFHARLYNFRVPDAYYLNPRNAARYERDMGRFSDTVDDIPFYVGLAREAAARGEAVLELACGTGRVTIPMAQAGARVTGLDNSPAMLEIARAKTVAVGADVRWVEGDMAGFELGEQYGLVTIPFRSFLHLVTDEEQSGCLASVHRHLIAGGRLALNFYVPATVSGSAVRVSGVYRGMRLREVSRTEMEELLDNAGFAVEALHGWFDGRDYTASSSECVWLARKLST